MATNTPAPPATPAPTPAPVPPAPSPWSNPATYLHFLAVIIGALLTAGVIPATSEASRIVGTLAAVLVALGFPVVTSIQTSANARAHAIRANVARALVTVGASALIFLAIGTLAIASNGCAGAQKIASSASACTVATLETEVGDTTLIHVIEADLLTDNYAAAVAAAGVKFGDDAVNCVLEAIADVEEAATAAGSGSGSGSGGATSKAITREDTLRTRAKEMLASRRAAK